MSEGVGYGCTAVVVFLVVWIGCTLSFGGLGFMLGWMPAMILAAIWPLVAHSTHRDQSVHAIVITETTTS